MSTQAQNIPDYSDIQSARRYILKYIHRTPILTSHLVNERVDAEVAFKCENFQKGGAFKFRGACNAVAQLEADQLERGVATHSSGNHAQAVALAARIKDIDAHIVMPEDAPEVKKQAVRDYGAEITFCEPIMKAREETLEQIVEETSAVFIPPYDHPDIIAGQATCTKELLMECPELDYLLVPVGGGGLISGAGIAADTISPETKIIGCEPELADYGRQSLKYDSLQSAGESDTIADGLRASPGTLNFACMQKYVDGMVTATEEQIVEAMKFIWERLNIIIEPSSAVPVAALFNKKMDAKGMKVGIILSGGNVDLQRLPW